MPELPEVESIKLQLQKFIVGHTIKDFELRIKKYGVWQRKQLINSKIVNVRRFGKVLVIDLSNDYSIVVHVKMTGQFIYQGPNLRHALSSSTRSGIHMDSRFRGNDKGDGNRPIQISKKVVGGVPGKHTHVIFKLDKGGVLYFNDYRRFGWMRLEKTPDIKNSKDPNNFLGKLGPEFLADLTLQKFFEILGKTSKPIKVLLIDQEKMAGVGNIYANDALFLAGIDPRKKSSSLSPSTREKLFGAVEAVLKEGIKRGGASELAFVTPDGGEGNYQNFTLVYNREGEPCRKCKTPIKKIKFGGRGTYYCPKCQT